MTKTIIQYTYRRNGCTPMRSEVGPVIMSKADDGRAPLIQAQEVCDQYGDTALTAERIPAPLSTRNLQAEYSAALAAEDRTRAAYELAVEYGTMEEAQAAWDQYARATADRAHATYRLEGLM